MADVPDLCDRLRVNSCRLSHESEDDAAKRRIRTDLEAARALEQEVSNWKRRNNDALAAERSRDVLYEALQTADDALSMIQAAGVKGVPHGMDLNNVRAIVARAIRAKDASLPNGDGGCP